MVKWLACATLALLAPGQANKNPDFYYLEEWGVSVMKPPKNEEWEFKTTKGKLSNSQLIVGHRVDDLSIEFFAQAPETGKTIDVKGSAENEWDGQSKGENVKEAKKVKFENIQLPGKGADGARAWYLEMLLKMKNDSDFHWRMYVFVSGKNQAFYKISILGDEATCKKHQKWIDYILSSVRCSKLPRKK